MNIEIIRNTLYKVAPSPVVGPGLWAGAPGVAGGWFRWGAGTACSCTRLLS